MKILYQEKVDSDFIKKVIEISNKLNINPNWLMALMNNESGLSHTITNSIGCVGLIQFCSPSRKFLKISAEELRNMTAVEQLDYVYKYFNIYKHKIKSYVDLYMTAFFPLAVGKSREFILESKKLSRSIIAKQNPSFNTDKNNYLTVGEVEDAMLRKIPATYLPVFTRQIDNTGKKKDKLLLFLGLGVVVTGGVIYYNKKIKK